jgi:hypothetical protein
MIESKVNLKMSQSSKMLVISMNVFILVDSVGPPNAEVCRTAASFP